MTRKIPVICMEDELQNAGYLPISTRRDRYVNFDDDGNVDEIYSRLLNGMFMLHREHTGTNYRPALERV